MKYYASISYDGSFFKGIAIQPDQKTIKGVFDFVLSKFFQQEIKMYLVSRTDKGVHAMDSRICFELETKIPVNKLAEVLNPKLENIQINWLQEVSPDFILQKQEFSKLYKYQIKLGKTYPFEKNYNWLLDTIEYSHDFLQEILDAFLGEHDFRNFCKVDHTRNIINYTRNIQKIYFKKNENQLIIFIQGNGFLWMMVRYIVNVIISCMKLMINKSDIKNLLTGATPSKECLKVLRPAPAEGLYLYSTVGTNELSL
ncbi:MAG: hypothetical protein COB02_08575 [Candidatus Cloacimonadota bacterium]|nr:MAG: hypothetical protein COB02_08575 [Candidatus Cloacimonadota bacterium]